MAGLDFEFFYNWAENHLDINLDAYKERQLQRRIGTIMRRSGASDLRSYAERIAEDDAVKKEFLDYITINVTEFFRNKDLFDVLEPLMTDTLYPKFGPLKIWSAACSIGAEPYSLAIILKRHNIKMKDPVLATDIDRTILERAKQGMFKKGELKNMSADDKAAYFTEKEDRYIIKNHIKRMVKFKKHDLINGTYAKGFHVVVCRNVTIYFKTDIKEAIYHNVSQSLVPGGLFFTGATETIYQPEKFGLKKVSSFIYEKM